jgi:hypothetical protein
MAMNLQICNLRCEIPILSIPPTIAMSRRFWDNSLLFLKWRVKAGSWTADVFLNLFVLSGIPLFGRC